MDKTYVKSNITLEDVRPHISRINAYFCVPFDDGGFMMTEEEIKKAKKEFDAAFIKFTSMILGITEEEAKVKTKTNKEKGYWAWKHNVNYEVKNRSKHPSFSVMVHSPERVTLDVSEDKGYNINYFELTPDGKIFQSPKSDINSIDDISKKLKKIKMDDINKELKKLKDYKKKASKELETTRNNIKKLEEELNKLDIT